MFFDIVFSMSHPYDDLKSTVHSLLKEFKYFQINLASLQLLKRPVVSSLSLKLFPARIGFLHSVHSMSICFLECYGMSRFFFPFDDKCEMTCSILRRAPLQSQTLEPEKASLISETEHKR